jgi:hypothetical protein
MTMTFLGMPVRLYSSLDGVSHGKPDWEGTLDQFWQTNQEAYPTWGDIRPIGDELVATDSYHGDGGASGEFWLVRGEHTVGVPAPEGWDKVDTSTEATDAERSEGGRTNTSRILARAERAERQRDMLMTELRSLADYYECYRQKKREKEPSDAVARARALLARIEGPQS